MKKILVLVMLFWGLQAVAADVDWFGENSQLVPKMEKEVVELGEVATDTAKETPCGRSRSFDPKLELLEIEKMGGSKSGTETGKY